MDFEKNRRRQNLKVIISEAVMVLAVIVMVVVLAFIVSGYWLNSDFEIKRQGMLQVFSVPTGADVYIDGELSWLQRTNTSKVLPSGEHTITLTKDGYDSWTKTINVTEGLLYRLRYPRLFLNERSTEKLIPTTGTTLAAISPDHERLLLINDTTEWSYINLNDEKLSPKKINIAGFFTSTSLAQGATVGLFPAEIISIDWSLDGSSALFKTHSEKGIEWTILNFDNLNNSINLTKEFGADFDTVKIYNRSATTLLVTQNNNLHKIDVNGRSISSVLAQDVISFDYYNNEVFFSALCSDSDSGPEYCINRLNIGDNRVARLGRFSSPPNVVVTKFYEDKYILALTGNEAVLYKYAPDNFDEVDSYKADFTPKNIKVGYEGEFIVLYDGRQIATLDMESRTFRNWMVDGETFGWIDNEMIYTILDGELIVYDFDGLNRRVLAENASSHFPAAITDNRYLYYFSDDTLTREWLVPR